MVEDQVLFRDVNLPVESANSRQLDFVAWGFRSFSHPMYGDATIASPLHRDRTPHALTAEIDRTSFLRAVADMEGTYAKLARQNRYGELTVLACETGGRWPSESPHDDFGAYRGEDENAQETWRHYPGG